MIFISLSRIGFTLGHDSLDVSSAARVWLALIASCVDRMASDHAPVWYQATALQAYSQSDAIPMIQVCTGVRS